MHYHRVCMRHQQHGGGQPSSHSYRKGTVKRSRKKCLNWQILLVPPRARAVCTSERGYVSRNLHLVRAVGHPHILRWRTAKQPELQQKEASELAKSPRSAKSKSCDHGDKTWCAPTTKELKIEDQRDTAGSMVVKTLEPA
ncbi:uncharacterized protein LOC115339608 isoform X6 [Aquila chrysaetos chrysaetos]|uniref:uncharacterized protein LOC115339608 isoform X6 n=1 Tax=Aquila chrysaetos chrysaetos TaxID=223781 RepID=UPI0011766EE5|nr:uncharacterized protein LOC115339608 isoform X6 [Aquila chrysaetos chrysaetos]